MSDSPPPLRYAILELSLRCNLRCVHCASGSGRPRPAELDLEQWREVVQDLIALDCPAVDLMGGEVLLSPLLEPVGRLFHDAGRPWGLLTNGWLLDAARARELVALGCRGIGISLDGATAETHDWIRGRAGAFERALAALDRLAELDFKPRNRSVLTSVNRRNLAELEAMGELLSRRFPGFRWQINLSSASAPRLEQELRLDHAQIEQVARFVHRCRSERRFELEISAAHDMGYFVDADLDLHGWEGGWDGCPAGIHHLGVQSDGQVKGCLALDETFTVGRVTETRLRDLWHDEERMARYRRVTVDELGPGCRECVWGARCRGGCTAYSSARTGQPHSHPDCLWRAASGSVRERQVRRVDPGPVTHHGPYLAGEVIEDLPEPAPTETDAWPLPLLSACIELTLRCNLRCLHCGSAAGSARNRELDLSSFLDLFRDLHLLGCRRVVLLGGEPLLHPDWQSIAMMATGFDLETALITNGLQVTGTAAARMAELGLSHVGVSIDGGTDETNDRIRGVPGTRERAWTAVDRLRDAGLPVTVITTINRLNLGELPLIRDELARRGGIVWQIQAANGTGERFAEELMLPPSGLLEAARFIEQTRASVPRERLGLAGGHNIGHHACSVRDYGTRGRWQGCPGGVTAVGICSDGAVKGCLSMSPCEIQGNIHERPLLELWRDPQSFARIRHYTPGRLTGGCGSCPHGSTCRGGCPEMARTATGDVWDNPFCLRQAERT